MDATSKSPFPPCGALWQQLAAQPRPVRRKLVRKRQALFHSGQPAEFLYLVHSGFFKTLVVSDDGRERITGFHLRGDLLGGDAIGLPVYTCDAAALDVGEVWELPIARLRSAPELVPELASALAHEIRRDWRWMLDLGSLNAEQRVTAFLIDLGVRMDALGFSRDRLRLRMTRAEIGSFLSLNLETVARTLSRLAAAGLITVDGREIEVRDADALQRVVTA